MTHPLLDRLRAATGPDRALDAEIWAYSPNYRRHYHVGDEIKERAYREMAAPGYTAHSGAVLALAAQLFPGRVWGETEPLALLCALLSALASKEAR